MRFISSILLPLVYACSSLKKFRAFLAVHSTSVHKSALSSSVKFSVKIFNQFFVLFLFSDNRPLPYLWDTDRWFVFLSCLSPWLQIFFCPLSDTSGNINQRLQHILSDSRLPADFYHKKCWPKLRILSDDSLSRAIPVKRFVTDSHFTRFPEDSSLSIISSLVPDIRK